MQVFFDPDTDMLGVSFAPGRPARSSFIGDGRMIEYSQAGGVIGLEFEAARRGVKISDLPVDTDALAAELDRLGIPVLDLPRVSGKLKAQSAVSASSALTSSLAAM